MMASDLLTLPMELRRQVCGNEVGMAMVAMTCRWAADHWRPPTKRRRHLLLYQAVLQDACNIVPLLTLGHSAWWFARCAILAWQNDCIACWDAMIARATRALSDHRRRPVPTLLLCASNRELLQSRPLCLKSVGRVVPFYERCRCYALRHDDPDAYIHLGGVMNGRWSWESTRTLNAWRDYCTCQPRPLLTGDDD